MTEITDLPEEVLRIIFKKLDGKTLFRVACVCKFWHRIVHELKRNVKMWFTFCLTEIPMPLLAEMTGLVDVNNLLLAGFTATEAEKKEQKTSTRNVSSPESNNENSMLSPLEQKKVSVVSTRLPWQFWREVYLAYRRSSLISRWPCLRRTVFTQNLDYYGKTTCVKFHGKSIIFFFF